MTLKRILLTIAALTTCFGCQTSHISSTTELIGIWKTSAPEYKDRTLEVTKNQVIFISGEQVINIYTITKIKEFQQDDNWILYTVDCEYYDENKEQQKQTLSFQYNPDNGGVIIFKNKDSVEWKKKV